MRVKGLHQYHVSEQRMKLLKKRLEHQGIEVTGIRGSLGKATKIRDYATGSCDDCWVLRDLVSQVSVIEQSRVQKLIIGVSRPQR